MRKLYFLIFYFLNFDSLSSTEDLNQIKISTSQFDLYEIENLKYNFEIQNEPISKNDLLDASFILITNKHGQLYGCNLTDVLNTLNEINNSDSDKQAFNFTYIKTEVDRVLGQLDKTNVCITKNQGWWSYEFCLGKYIHQFHVLTNGSIVEPVINLGNYSADWNWLQTNESNLLRLDNKLYHEQYFDIDGSLCELNNKPRRATVKFFCDEMTLNHIDSINEIESCVYEIHVHSSNLCYIKNFNKKYQNSNIKCNPLLNHNDYEKYMSNKVEAVEKSKVEAIFESKEDDNELLIDQLNQDLMNNAEKIKELQEKTQYYENLIKSKNNDDELNLIDEIKNTEIDLMKSADSLLKTNEMLKKLSDNLNNIIDNIDVDADADEYVERIDADDNSVEITDDSLLSTRASTTTTTTSFNDNKVSTSTLEMKIKVSVLDAKSDIAKEIRKLTGLDDQLEADNNAKSLENSIKEKLMSKNSKFKDIEVKIISLDGFNSNSINSESVGKLISSLFGDAENKETLSNLNKNYNLVFNNGEFINRDESNNNNKEEEEEEEELFIRY